MPRLAALAATLSATALLAAACGDGGQAARARAQAAAPVGTAHPGEGVLVALQGDTAVIEHEGVAGRPAGRETFAADGAALAEAPAAGSKVRFELFVAETGATLSALAARDDGA